MPRHSKVSPAVARSIADKAGWSDSTGQGERQAAAMTRYPALLDGERGAYGVSFPDLPGIVAMGETVDEALVNAEEALRDYVIEAEGTGGAVEPPTPPEQLNTSGTVVLVPSIRVSGRRVRANLSLHEGVEPVNARGLASPAPRSRPPGGIR